MLQGSDCSAKKKKKKRKSAQSWVSNENLSDSNHTKFEGDYGKLSILLILLLITLMMVHELTIQNLQFLDHPGEKNFRKQIIH